MLVLNSFLCPLALPMALTFLGLILPLPKNRLCGVLYWSAFTWMACLMLLLEYLIVGGMLVAHGPTAGRIAAVFPVPALFLIMFASWFWGRDQDRRMPVSFDEEQRKEGRRRIGRRLWFVLLGIQLLLFIVTSVSLIQMMSTKMIVVPPLPPAPPTSTSGP